MEWTKRKCFHKTVCKAARSLDTSLDHKIIYLHWPTSKTAAYKEITGLESKDKIILQLLLSQKTSRR